MKYRRLGQSGIIVSNLGFGTWNLSGDETWGPQDEQGAVAAIRAAYDEGVRFFDTARCYGAGRSERILGKALGDVRSRVTLATKVGPTFFSPKVLREACVESLRNLDSEYIDLYQLHWANPKFPIAETLGVLDQLRKEGKIREYGVSNFGPRDLAGALAPKRFPVVSNQVAYSLLFRAVETDILPLCHKEKIDVLAYSPLLHGLLTGKFDTAEKVPEGRARTRHFAGTRPGTRHGEAGAEAETFEAIAKIGAVARDLGEPIGAVSLAWVLAQPGVACVIAGARTAYQARRNARAGNLVLPPGVVQQLKEITEPLRVKLGPNADMWEAASRVK